MLRRSVYKFSHTVEMNSEYYLTKYDLKDIYKLQYPRKAGYATIEGT